MKNISIAEGPFRGSLSQSIQTADGPLKSTMVNFSDRRPFSMGSRMMTQSNRTTGRGTEESMRMKSQLG
jgi:hypothetical protein